MPDARAPQPDGQAYAGEISARKAWEALTADKSAQLVDVRTTAEWNFVGVPDLSPLGRNALLCEWQVYPSLGRNPHFTAELGAALADAGYRKGAPIFVICRSGSRSRAAAIALTAAGFGPCFNIADGFEGGLDAERHRGRAVGWKAEGLPWVQS